MNQETQQAEAVFTSQLLDATGQPYLIRNSPQCNELIWALVNNQNSELTVTPFPSGKVDEKQYHFVFEFSPGALTKAPKLDGWDVYAARDNDGLINSLYIALSGSSPLSIDPGKSNKAALTYIDANPKDSDTTKIDVSLTTGSSDLVKQGDKPIPNKTCGFTLTMVEANTPALSVPPLAVDFVGRRTVLNDGQSSNSFTFALTNMTQADITLTKDVKFAVWFDAAPNDPTQGYPSALARVQDLTDTHFGLTASPDWKVTPPPSMVALTPTPVSPMWQFNVANDFVLKQQDPVFFTFSGLKTDLDPGVTRMYLRFEALPGFPPGVLIAELEKTPLLYGLARGQGCYLSAGKPEGNTPHAPNYDSGLYVQQFGDGAAAIFNGGRVGIGTGPGVPAAKLHIVDVNQNPNGGTLILGSENPTDAGLRFGCETGYAWIQAHAGKPLAINPLLHNVGIGTATPGSSLSVAGGVAIGKTFATVTPEVTQNNLAVEGSVGIGTTKPGSSLSVTGGVAVGKTFATATPAITQNDLAVEGNVGIGTTKPGSSLSVTGGVAIGETFATATPAITQSDLAVEGSVGIGTTKPGSSLSVSGGVAIGKTFATATPPIAQNDLAVEGHIGIGIPKPNCPLSFPDVLGDKISLWGQSSNHYGVGVQGGLLQLYTDGSGGDIAFGYGSSSSFTETMRIKGTGNLQIGASNDPKTDSRLALTNGTYTAFVDTNLRAEICNDIHSYQALMLLGNRSRQAGQSPRWVQAWDNLEVKGNLYVSGKACVYLDAYKAWYYLTYEGGNWGVFYGNDPGPTAPSDLRLKSELQSISSALDRVRRLRGVTYRWNENAIRHFTSDIETTMSAGPNATEQENQKVWQAEHDRRRDRLAMTHIGVIAQEVEAVLPAAVTTDAEGHKSVRYHNLIPLLIEAIKEQDLAVTAQASLSARLQTEIEQLKQALQARSAARAVGSVSEVALINKSDRGTSN